MQWRNTCNRSFSVEDKMITPVGQAKAPAELLTSYGKLALEDANEAETRLKLIDEIVFGILVGRMQT